MEINSPEKSFDDKLFKAFLIFVILVLGITILLSIGPFANAQTDDSLETIVVSDTIQSFQDPGIGHEEHQLAIILNATENILYNGTITFNATKPIQIIELIGPFESDELTAPTIWTSDGDAFFTLNLVNLNESSGDWIFSANVFALHAMNSEPFSVTYTVEYIEQRQDVAIQMENTDVSEDVETPIENTNATEVIEDSDVTETVEEAEDIEEKEIIPSPRQQMKSGVYRTEVVCKEGLGLIFKATTRLAACVTPSTALVLIERGWAASETI